MNNVTIKTENGILNKKYNNNTLISDVLKDLDLSFDFPCNGRGTCGKCKIKAYGHLSDISHSELNKLSENEIEKDFRLSCQAEILGDVTIDCTFLHGKNIGISTGIMPKFKKDPITSVKNCLGVAIDIGTTTIAAYLYSFPECKLIKTLCVKNNQTRFGADVVSRIDYSISNGSKELKEVTENQINEIICSLTSEKVDTIVITGNTIMLHFLTGLDTKEIAVYPFTPKSLFGIWKDRVYLCKCISAYVGADITTAILASNMTRCDTSFLVDIGTNGEMALWHNNELICCSTAAGPAFEGSSLSHGMLALPGAIYKVYLEENEVKYKTIDNLPAAGICGTGVIDALSVMKDLGVIDSSGYMDEDFKIGDSNVFITLADIRAIQLAKSAIRAGIDTLIHESGINVSDIERFYIAGGFGSFTDINSAANIGLVPKEIMLNTEALGNAAGIGASMILQSKEMLKKSEQLAKSARTVELSTTKFFMDKYIENMMF